jgi:hypothetical protein
VGGITMTIEAKLVGKGIQAKLPLISSSLVCLDDYLKDKGFKFNQDAGKYECVYKNADNTSYLLNWYMQGIPNATVCTFEGEVFPYENDIRDIIFPIKLKSVYHLKVNEKNFNAVVKLLFNRKFELVGISEDCHNQIFEYKKNKIELLLSSKDNMFDLYFNGYDNMSRSLLSEMRIL